MTERRRALLSVSDKNGVEAFGRALAALGFELLSTGGTARTLRAAGLDVTDVADVTGHPEMMDGRVKTLHPAIHGPLLDRRDVPGDLAALEARGYEAIDLVVVNLYPFRETVAGEGVTVEEAMAKVDIGGPTMIRAAAKNHANVFVVVDPEDYDRVLEVIEAGGDDSLLRRELAVKVFQHISAYDAAIADFLARDSGRLPDPFHPAFERVASLRYGENPDQEAAFYRNAGGAPRGIASLEQHHGKELSYNNLLDLDGALLSLSPFAFSPGPAVCIVKHTTPCGLAVGDSVSAAFSRALRTDPVSAFGSVIAVNRRVDADAAELMGTLFTECIVAPSFSDEALEILTKKKNVRILTFPVREGELPLPSQAAEALRNFETRAGSDEDARKAGRFLAAHGRDPEPVVPRGIYGGILLQTPPVPPLYGVDHEDWKVVTVRAPDTGEVEDLSFAWSAIYGVKSNAILIARQGVSLGIGAGQMSRVDSSRLAVQKAGDQGLSIEGAVLASDAFFPFRDGVDAAAEAGIRAIIQPGGSVRDEEVIAAADEAGIAMVFTGRRLFRH